MSPASGTTAEDYGRRYYTHCLGSDEPYSWDSPGWRTWFTGVARQLKRVLPPFSTLLDVGCAHGLLVQALVAEGVDARGFDVSTTAIAEAHPDVRDRVYVASATEPIAGRYDVVTCIEVLEHMSPLEAQVAIDNMCAVTDRVVLSSTPEDFHEATHINVHPLADWVADFAARGFYRRVDVDLSFLTPWAACFERAPLTTRDLAHRYEAHLYPLVLEVTAKRTALLEAQREVDRLAEEGDLDALRAELDAARAELADLRHQLLLQRDHAIGREAAAATARMEAERLRHELAAATHDLTAIRSSERWRLGGALVAPVAAAKRRTRR